jgi:ABC-type glycerol-3-phosphate transport system substrate-binding protein
MRHGTSAIALFAAMAVSAAAVAEDLAPTSDETVYFRGWQYRTDVVQDNVDRYNDELGGNVDYATVTGDYPAIMESQMIAGAQLDIIYANPSQAARYYDGGWVMPASVLPDFDEIKADLYPNILDAWTYKGELLGLSYFVSTRGVMHVNLERYYEAGFTDDDFPATWDELYEQVYALHEAGVESPILPHWFAEWYGISWAFLFEVMNRGGEVADADTHEPLLTAAGPAADTLEAWKQLWNSGLVPEEVLTYNESAYIDAYASGRFVFSPQQLYDLETFNRPDRTPFAGQASLLPYQGQSWGLLDSAVYLMTERNRSDAATEDVKRFGSWYGYRDHEGEVFVGMRWLRESMLFSGYRSVMESPEAEEVMRASLAREEDIEAVLEVYAATPYPKGVWNVVWAPEFDAWLREHLQEFLLQDLPVQPTIEAINDRIRQLNAQYGL